MFHFKKPVLYFQRRMNCYERLTAVVMLGSALAGCQPSVSDSPVADAEVGIATQSKSALASLDYGQSPRIHHDASGRVQVELSSAWSQDGLLVIRGIFTPDDAGFHLYSSSLPKEGVSGLGRPTLIEVSDSATFQDVGPLVSAEEPFSHHDETLDITLPIYHSGAVTLYLPLRFRALPQAPTQVPIRLTYMACSDMRCNSPVEGAAEEVTSPLPVGDFVER